MLNEETEKWRVLFVCGRNQWRSPTGEKLYENDQRMLVRSAGLRASSRRKLAAADIEWADVIFVMEAEQMKRIREGYRDLLGGIQLVNLEIPDEYQYMDPELIELLRAGVESWWEE
ncbi:Predicted protein tyrosine phosphatase [Rubritalea squalenifaciens DSM 18772]|uniref:Phosphotyrosine protein phosphatase I domain-containing protein n=1 Tax=Rubritalea squalenifaciens DSM 18772 TaxID=1123071 RepID=A0A1M6L1L8_9BACT|nr:phosphotyrosine protein phosphatase [Rubritalea squalenifaciens]SHJ65039.1 Predicted protein tyrosine phosphatase [Rubritalea squalenifaciens DSM 18772]